MNNRAQEWEDWKHLAWKVAGAFTTSKKLPYDYLKDIAEFALANALWDGKFNPDLGVERSTYLWNRIHNHLLEAVCRGKFPAGSGSVREWWRDVYTETDSDRRSSKKGEGWIDTSSAPSIAKGNDVPWLSRILRELGEEARALVLIVVEAPGDIIDEMVNGGKKTAARKKIRSYLRELGWSDQKISKAWDEVWEAL